MELIHGGDWVGFFREYGRLPLDFSASISPLGMPEGVERTAAEALAVADRYPDPLCRRLREALAVRFGLDPELVVCGGGTAELILRIALALRPGTALILTPTFAEYERTLSQVGARILRYTLRRENGFRVREDFLDRITEDVDMVILCEPNNPTGRTTPPSLLHAIWEKCEKKDTWLVADECYLPFLDAPREHTLTGKLMCSERLMVLRSFTKWYAMAGLRLGACLCGSGDLAAGLREAGAPWTVSSVAEAAGLAALREKAYDDRLRRVIGRERGRLAQGLRGLGCEVVPGEANFLLFSCGARGLYTGLRERGILLRDCGNFEGLEPGWYRTAVRTEEENGRLLAVLEEVLGHG